mmetsp:Transcript_7551/g.20712  ORF Transcript_7551/g.20712 Transcript_7551/m.20712 type:complete len:308 (+) Transcript_7551:93-1016(+)
MKLATGLSLLLAATMATVVDGQLFKRFKKLNPSKLTVPLAKKTPAELVQAVTEKAKEVVPKDLEGEIHDALNGSSVEDIQHKAVEKIGDAFQDITGKSNVSEAVESTKPQQDQLAKVLSRAGVALQKGADAIANASSSGVEDGLKDASAQAFDKSDFAGVKDALEKASPEEVASELRKATPEVAEALNRTTQQLAEQLKQASPKAVGLVNRTGNKLAEAIAPKRVPEDPAEGDLDDDFVFGQRGWVGLSVVLLLVLAVVAGYLVSLRFKTSQRTPVLLSDALDTTRGSTRDDRTVQLTTQEPFFSRM